MKNSRRTFLTTVSMLAGGSMVSLPSWGFGLGNAKLRSTWLAQVCGAPASGENALVQQYGDILEFVGLCDNNPGRLAYGKKYIGVNCPTFEDFEEMVSTTKPDLVIVTTKDSNHHEFIIKGLNMGCDVLTEKPLTIDEVKCQAILEAERNSKKNLIVGFNYRWSPYSTKIKELLMNGAIGKVTSVDFNWYLNTYHGASYFRRWHGLRQEGGTTLGT